MKHPERRPGINKHLLEGDSWGRLKLIRAEYIERKFHYPDRVEYVSDLRYTFQCDCGSKPFHRWAHEYEGKRRLRDCGKCRWDRYDKGRVQCSYYLPVDLVKKVMEYAHQERITISPAITKLAEGINHEWNWRLWRPGDIEMPEECWKWGIRPGERRSVVCLRMPNGLKEALLGAARMYGVSASRILTGMLSRALDGEDPRASHYEPNRVYQKRGDFK